jgi:phosphonatase-like hydrolase
MRPLAVPALAIFDLIGTTVAGSDAVGDLFEATLAEAGVRVDRTAIAQVRGLNKRDAFRRLAALAASEPMDADRLGAAWLESFRRKLIDKFAAEPAREIPGTTATFAWLGARGATIALCSGLEREVVCDLVARLGWTPPLVSLVVSGDDVARGRPAPDLIVEAMRLTGVADPDRVLVVGDTAADLQAARAAGIDAAVGVLSGAGTRETLEAHPHRAILASVRDLMSVLS